ncbi:MAG TPA: alpha/beta fold hydrolase [Rhizobiales bacterium]|nr:poly-beta-hydroxybutyrate polymerase [bacterium BMS3Bbin10]HDO52330.1 alpha/beta fold hydrolase [Hyphomicrobiales bacterium]
MRELPTRTRHVYPIDRFLHANEARLTAGLSPPSAMLAYLDWAVHLANSPGKQAELVNKAFRKSVKFGAYLERLASNREKCACKDECVCIEPLPQDRRFSAADWRQPPFSLYYQAFLFLQQWWHNATVGVHGVSKHHEDVVAFSARQFLDIFSPTNFLATNPIVLKATLDSGGMNLVRGFQNFVEDGERAILQKPPVGVENFRVGKEVAITPGKVVYRNRLIELIQYTPTTKTVHPEPILIVPAWIMKYYILDLSPNNSMVKYLVDQGHTVFMISWKNPTEEDRDLGMDDYIEHGVMQALEAVRAIVPEQPVHAVGYCIGGTLLSIAAAALGRNCKDWLKSMTLFAAQTDFTEAGELMLFIDQSQVAYLEDLMWDRGYLDTRQMAGAFQLLRSNDLIWSRMVHDYLMGERRPMIDLMAWNADATRLPYRMHSEYLRRLFLDNDLAEARYYVGDRPVALTDIRVPIFAVGAEKDHVAPWKSVFKINFLTDTDVTFLLTSGGHNAGIISEPGHPHRHHRIATKHEGDTYLAPDEWFAMTKERGGSWWPTWQAWLAEHSGDRVKPPNMGDAKAGLAPLCDAPGTYVLQE